MSIRDAYENCLIELNKVQAPSLLLEDFVYMFNKAVQQYINTRYLQFETKQQLTDDLRVLLMHTEYLKDPNPMLDQLPDLPTVKLPRDYMHILNCQIEFRSVGKGCKNGSIITTGVNKVDTNNWPHIISNYYMKPSVKQPYYYIINKAEPVLDGTYREDTFTSGQRCGNSVTPVMEMKYGSDKNYEVHKVHVDYLRNPKYYSLTPADLDDYTDASEVLEFPDYVAYEIINTLVKIILENSSDINRMQSHVAANTSIS